jgi:hypothetical protein
MADNDELALDAVHPLGGGRGGQRRVVGIGSG